MRPDRQQIRGWMSGMYWVQFMPEQPGTELPITQSTQVMLVGWPGSDRKPPEDGAPLVPCPHLPAMRLDDMTKLLSGLNWGQGTTACGYAGIVTDHRRLGTVKDELKPSAATESQLALFGEAA